MTDHPGGLCYACARGGGLLGEIRRHPLEVLAEGRVQGVEELRGTRQRRRRREARWCRGWRRERTSGDTSERAKESCSLHTARSLLSLSF